MKMNRKGQKLLAAMTMAAALLMTIPAAAQAAPVRRPVVELGSGLVERAWSWLESLLGAPQGLKVQRKDTTTPPPPTQPTPPPTQGPMIDPDGVR